MDTANSMGASALYGPENGIARMFSDLENYIYPIFAKFEPLTKALSNISFIIIPLIAACILCYIIFYRRHRFLDKITKRNNYIFWGICLVIYIGLTFTRIEFDYGFTLNASRLVLPLIAKLSGPYISAIFALLQYIVSAIINGGSFNILLMIIAAVSGMLYGLFFYKRRTKYTKCLGAKLTVNIVCNVFLTSFALLSQDGTNISAQLTASAINSIIMAPIQALFIYLLFRLIRFFKEHFAY